MSAVVDTNSLVDMSRQHTVAPSAAIATASRPLAPSSAIVQQTRASSTPCRVLVTDGHQRAALAVVRSLGRAGHAVFTASGNARSIAGASRFCRNDAAVADPLTEPLAFLRDIERLVAEQRIDILLPVTEAAFLALLPARSHFGDRLVPAPDVESFNAICDKSHVLHTARRLGIETPVQHILNDRVAAQAFAHHELRYPVVLKPSRSIGVSSGARVKLSVRHASSRVELLAALDGCDASSYPLLVQQRIDGPGVGMFILRWSGETVATFAHRRLREKPPAGGVSVYSESIPPDPSLLALSCRLLEELDWNGVAMVEFKTDRLTGVPYLMEINPRFWGSLQLAVTAGVDFPRLLVECARGARPTPVRTYRTAVRNRWWWGDVDHLLSRLRHSASALSLPPSAPSRGRALREFLRYRPSDRNEIFESSDPGPFLRETLNWLSGRSV